MSTLAIPSFERQLLQTVMEKLAAEPRHERPEQSLQPLQVIVQRMRENTANTRGMLEVLLAEGIEARSFARNYGPFLPGLEELIASIRETIRKAHSLQEDAEVPSLTAELHLLERETQSLRDLLAEALSRASEAPGPVDWGRVSAAGEAFARGETKPFSR